MKVFDKVQFFNDIYQFKIVNIKLYLKFFIPQNLFNSSTISYLHRQNHAL